MNGACTGGGSSGSDSGALLGVACGNTVCTAGQACCYDFELGAHCAGVGATCDEGILATCDGVEDCGGNACCEPVLGLPIACGPTKTCQNPGGDQICRDNSDCTDPEARNCCYNGIGLPGEPWGRCDDTCS